MWRYVGIWCNGPSLWKTIDGFGDWLLSRLYGSHMLSFLDIIEKFVFLGIFFVDTRYLNMVVAQFLQSTFQFIKNSENDKEIYWAWPFTISPVSTLFITYRLESNSLVILKQFMLFFFEEHHIYCLNLNVRANLTNVVSLYIDQWELLGLLPYEGWLSDLKMPVRDGANFSFNETEMPCGQKQGL